MVLKMLCNECNTREATIHLTQIVGETMTKRDLCEVCGKSIADMVKQGDALPLEAIATDTTETRLTLIVASDPRYAKAAYHFVQDGLTRAWTMFCEPGKSGHISGGPIARWLARARH